jgi:hypothetical protein
MKIKTTILCLPVVDIQKTLDFYKIVQDREIKRLGDWEIGRLKTTISQLQVQNDTYSCV